MCIDGWCILICGIDGRNRRVSKIPPPLTPYFTTPPTAYWCRHCDAFRAVEPRRREQWYSFCYVPLYPVKREQVYVGCAACHWQVDVGMPERRCGVCAQPVRGNFCQQCGTRV